MGRALVPGLAAALGFGIAFGYVLFPGVGAFAASAALLLVAMVFRSALFLWAAAFALGMSLPTQTPWPPHLRFQLPLVREVTGQVLDLPDPRARTDAVTVAPVNLPVLLLAYVPKGANVAPGDIVRLRGEFSFPQPEGWRLYLERRGIRGLFFAREVEVVTPGRPGLLRWVAGLRARMLDQLRGSVPGLGGALLAALLLGARGELPDDEVEAFRLAGVAHVLALSGLHVGILSAGGWWLLGLLRWRPSWRYLVLIPAVGLYVLLGGARVSLIRAALMFAVLGLFWVLWEGGWVLRRWLDPLQGLSLAALIVLVLWPHSALEAGFLLSFSATAAILVFVPGWLRWPGRGRLPKLVRRGADLLAVTVCAQLGSLPVLGSTFGYIAAYGLLGNLLLVPWTAVLLWVGLVNWGLAFTPWGPNVGAWVDTVLVRPYLAVVRLLGSGPGAALPVGPGFALWYLLALLGILALRAYGEEVNQ